MNGLQFLGIAMMGWAAAPTPDDALYAAGVAPGVVKDAGLFLAGMAVFLGGTFMVKK